MSNNDIFSIERKIIDLNKVDLMSIETFSEFKPIQDYDPKTGICHPTLMELDKISRNSSYYDVDSVLEALNAEYINEQIMNRIWFGELDHPANMDGTELSKIRFFTILKDQVSHRINSWKRVNDSIVGEVQFVKPKGDIVTDWVEKHANMAFSIRMYTPNISKKTNEQGQEYKHKYGKMTLITFDAVTVPGYRGARMQNPDTLNSVSTESFDGISIQWTSERKQNEIFNLLQSQETLPIMEDTFGFKLEPNDVIGYSKEGFITVKLGNSNTKSISIPSNVMSINQVLNSCK